MKSEVEEVHLTGWEFLVPVKVLVCLVTSGQAGLQLGLTAAPLRTEQLAPYKPPQQRYTDCVVFQIFYRNRKQIHHVYNESRIVSESIV